MFSRYLNIAKQFFPEKSIRSYKEEEFYVKGDGLTPFFSHFILLKYISNNSLFVAPKIAISKLNDQLELIPLSKSNELADYLFQFKKIENISFTQFTKECKDLLSKIKQAQIDYKLKNIEKDF